jgi:hypothetical protein
MRRIILSFAVLSVLSTGVASTAEGVTTSTKKISSSNGGEALDGSKPSSARSKKISPSNGGKALAGSKSSAPDSSPSPSNGGEALKGSK